MVQLKQRASFATFRVLAVLQHFTDDNVGVQPDAVKTVKLQCDVRVQADQM
jgi:hypothetical protein